MFSRVFFQLLQLQLISEVRMDAECDVTNVVTQAASDRFHATYTTAAQAHSVNVEDWNDSLEG